MTARPDGKRALEARLSEIPAALSDLQRAASAKPDLLPLDLSYASLDRREALYSLMLAGQAQPDMEADRRFAWYLGETLRTRAGGKWALDKDGLPIVKGLPELPTTCHFDPSTPVFDYRRRRRLGTLREGVQIFDIAYMRTRVAEFVAEMPCELRALAADPWVTEAEVGTLDPKSASLDACDGLQRALLLAREGGLGVDELETLRRRIARYLGETLRSRIPGEWTVSENPRDTAFGMFRLHSWAPKQLVGNLTASSPPDYFRRAIKSITGEK